MRSPASPDKTYRQSVMGGGLTTTLRVSDPFLADQIVHVADLRPSGVYGRPTAAVNSYSQNYPIYEEIGGQDGMAKFVHTDAFKNLNIGFALDEGIASPNNEFIVFHGERSIWQIHVHCSGQPGHASLLLPNTAGEKLRYIINKFLDMREEQKKILDSDANLSIGDVTTVNLTQIHGGVQTNVIPEKLTAVFDIRLAVTVDFEGFENTIKKWCAEAGEGVTYEFEQKNPKVECTKIDASNPYWTAFKSALDSLQLNYSCRIFPGATDSRYVRRVGIPAIGFSPMNNTPVLLHDHNEFLEADIFLKGIQYYVKIIMNVANV
ncbi:Aminoacylase-1 [Eumeta japonica]|uniref:N-acyl-aliphatic-L-amino acid amidohydrolase n=1 Tax=Eumeta variegata TaxID=151549 RepID=A0A4C1U2F4_EUMVA|nr:Aminoacylase-1 [Eumeta japonica]